MSETKGLSLGDRMKLYERAGERYLTRHVPVILRLDGCHFHTWTRGLPRPYSEDLRKCMEYAAYTVCKEISGACLAYTQSDEISILITDYKELNTEPWFSYRGNKVESVSASICTNGFNTAAMTYLPDQIKKKGFAIFDARAFNIPKEDVLGCFLWRQRDCEKNSVSSLAQAHFSHKELHGKNSSDMQDMLMLKKDINWNDIATKYKRGTALYKVQVESPNPVDPEGPTVIRNKWIADYEMPIITKDRPYIERWIDPNTLISGLPDKCAVLEDLRL